MNPDQMTLLEVMRSESAVFSIMYKTGFSRTSFTVSDIMFWICLFPCKLKYQESEKVLGTETTSCSCAYPEVFFLVHERREDPNTTKNGPSLACQRNAVSMMMAQR